jgi:hypothetical protein
LFKKVEVVLRLKRRSGGLGKERSRTEKSRKERSRKGRSRKERSKTEK